MNKKEYIKPVMDVVNVTPQSMIAGSPLPASVPGGFPGLNLGGGGIKANPFDDVEDMTDFDSQINGLLW
jgi:hypothetical protein